MTAISNSVAALSVLTVIFTSFSPSHAASDNYQAGIKDLQVMQEDYPKAVFFREEFIRTPRLERIGIAPADYMEPVMKELMGNIPKALSEELPHERHDHASVHRELKKRFPEKMILIHYNLRGLRPYWYDLQDNKVIEHDDFFPGHWLHYNRAEVLSDIPASGENTVIKVSDPRLFKVEYVLDASDDITIYELDEEGNPDWHNSETCRVIEVDEENSTITVKRGLFGSEPAQFSKDNTYAAARAGEGPWPPGRNRTQFSWVYNLSSECPRDDKGRTAADVLLERIEGYFRAGGPLHGLDGIQFDVPFVEYTVMARLRWRTPYRGIDLNNDGNINNDGYVDGRQVLTIGMTDFLKALRERMGDDFIIAADGCSPSNQAAYGIINGIESEGWPKKADHDMIRWNEGYNRHAFWQENAREPSINYIKHDWHIGNDLSVPYGRHALVFATATMTGSAIAHHTVPPIEGVEDTPRIHPEIELALWDEFRGGQLDTSGWLGKPLSPPRHLAERSDNILAGRWQEKIQVQGGTLAKSEGSVKITPDMKPVSSDTAATDIVSFYLEGIEVPQREFTLSFRIRGNNPEGYPASLHRWLWLEPVKDADSTQSLSMRHYTPFGSDDYKAWFYFCPQDVPEEEIDISFKAQYKTPFTISDISIYLHPKAIVQEYENGVILANPSAGEFTFDLNELFPGTALRHLATRYYDQGAEFDDWNRWNRGEKCTGKVTLPAKEAVFLRKEFEN